VKEDSYVCGISDAPLLGDTIGHSLDKAVARWGDREALVSPSHGVRWTWTQFAERVDALAAGFLALGLERGARIGIWSLNRPEADTIRGCAGRIDPRHHQPRLPAERARIRARQGRL
jgi:non-ribosomal peptide synthetase component F